MLASTLRVAAAGKAPLDHAEAHKGESGLTMLAALGDEDLQAQLLCASSLLVPWSEGYDAAAGWGARTPS